MREHPPWSLTVQNGQQFGHDNLNNNTADKLELNKVRSEWLKKHDFNHIFQNLSPLTGFESVV